MIRQRVNLAFPIELPGGTVSHVIAHAPDMVARDLAQSGPNGKVLAVARCLGLPRTIVEEMDDADHARVVHAIANLAAEAQAQFLASRPKPFTVFDGGHSS
jgi:hypothetical protein